MSVDGPPREMWIDRHPVIVMAVLMVAIVLTLAALDQLGGS